MALLIQVLAAAASLCGLCKAASNFTTVPHGTVIPGEYNDFLRPYMHLSPPQGFMSYPTGLFIDNNTFHAYYLCKCL
jgi:sucrose-6-phosphate hydrolase SacC (GH32 family)